MKRFLLLTLLTVLFGNGYMFANHATHYGKAVAVTTGKGTVYVSTSSTSKTDGTESGSNNGDSSSSAIFNCGGNSANDAQTLYFYATPLDGYHLAGWNTSSSSTTYDSTDNIYAVTITAASKDSSDPTTVTQYAHFEKNPSATVTYKTPTNGAYTVTYSDETISMASGAADHQKESSSNATLKATPASGYQVLGWYTTNGMTKSYFSYDTTVENMTFDNGVSVGVDFVSTSQPVFIIKSNPETPYTDLSTANSKASAGSGDGKIIVLIKDGTLKAGSYTISSGNTLLIPFDSNYTLYTTSPEMTAGTATYVTPSAYRTLTLANGAKITVAGDICVNAKMLAGNGGHQAGLVNGQYGYIKMTDGSSITLNSGANLYAWGYISGDGSIEAKSGAKVYENFQIMDFRGGTALSDMAGNTQKVFPTSQYYIQNIESMLKINYGAEEHCTSGVYSRDGTVMTVQSMGDLTFVGSTEGMFLLSNGAYLTKKYNPTTDRINYTLNGKATIGTMTVSSGAVSVNSSYYTLPLTNNMTVTLESGTLDTDKDIAMLPGFEMNIAQNAMFTIAENTSVYVYDKDSYTNQNLYDEKEDYNFRPLFYTPTNPDLATNPIRKVTDLVDAKINVEGSINSIGYLYTTEGGANICSEGNGIVTLVNGAGSATVTYQTLQDVSAVTYASIPITSAKLHNGSTYAGTAEEYVATAGVSAQATYKSRMEKWRNGDMTVYLGSETSKDIASSEWAATRAETPNAIAIASVDDVVGLGLNDINVVYSDGDTYKCDNFKLTDLKNFYSPVDFTATKLSYSRQMDTKWGTTILPYPVSSVDNSVEYYSITGIQDDALVIEKYSELPAGTPALVKNISGDGIQTSLENVDVKKDINNVTSGSITMTGKYTNDNKITNGYYILKNQFHKGDATNWYYIDAFRAYFTTSSSAKPEILSIPDDEATIVIDALTGNSDVTIDGIYDTNGVRQQDLKKGINIVRMSNGKTKKIIVK